jgi:hypothetical protein
MRAEDGDDRWVGAAAPPNRIRCAQDPYYVLDGRDCSRDLAPKKYTEILLFPPARSSLLLVTGGVAPRPMLTLCGNAVGRRGTCLQGLGIMVSAAVL